MRLQVLGGEQVLPDHGDINAILHCRRHQGTWQQQRDAWQEAILQIKVLLKDSL